MSLRETSALISTALVVVGTIWYIYLALKGIKVKPVLASWIVLSGTMTLSFATYWTTPNRNLVSNACNAISVLSTGAILLTTLWLAMKDGKKISFNPFQKKCLGASLVITILWIVIVWGYHGTGFIPNVLTQIVLLIGYFVTAQKLWHSVGNNESMFTWWCILIAAAVALYTGIVSHDGLVVLFASRTIFGTTMLIWLMYRAERKKESL